MGNCMETCCTPAAPDQAQGSKAEVDKTSPGYDADDDCGLQKGSPPPGGKGGLKVRIVLTKAELEWLMLLLKEEKAGGVEGEALEKALEEIRRGRKQEGAAEKQGWRWKPSLESIMECPETQSFQR